MTLTIPIVILAGGQGSRIGGNKSERLLAGVSLLDRALAKAAKYSSPVMVSVGTGEFTLPPDIYMLEDEAYIGGPIAGLASALKFASKVNALHVMIMPCDTPFLPDCLLQRLQDGIGESVAALSRYDRWLHPACSLWRAEAANLLPDYLASGRRSLIGFAQTVGYVAADLPIEDVDPFLNINTVADLLLAEEILAQRHVQN